MIQTNLPHAGKHFFAEDEINSDIEEQEEDLEAQEIVPTCQVID